MTKPAEDRPPRHRVLQPQRAAPGAATRGQGATEAGPLAQGSDCAAFLGRGHRIGHAEAREAGVDGRHRGRPVQVAARNCQRQQGHAPLELLPHRGPEWLATAGRPLDEHVDVPQAGQQVAPQHHNRHQVAGQPLHFFARDKATRLQRVGQGTADLVVALRRGPPLAPCHVQREPE